MTGEWQPIETIPGHGAVLVGHPHHLPTTAFLDATHKWRVFRSQGGMKRLPFEPTHWQPLPDPPKEPA